VKAIPGQCLLHVCSSVGTYSRGQICAPWEPPTNDVTEREDMPGCLATDMVWGTAPGGVMLDSRGDRAVPRLVSGCPVKPNLGDAAR